MSPFVFVENKNSPKERMMKMDFTNPASPNNLLNPLNPLSPFHPANQESNNPHKDTSTSTQQPSQPPKERYDNPQALGESLMWMFMAILMFFIFIVCMAASEK